MSPSTQYTISTKAYAKIVLHASKHPYVTVNGLLIGNNGTNDGVEVTDAVPLFHHWTTLTPMLEVGLQQVDSYAAKQKQRIVGYYHANESVNDKSLPAFGAKIITKIRESFSDAIALVVLNTKLSPEKPEIAILPYIFRENQWRPVRQAFEVDNNSNDNSTSASSPNFTLTSPDAPTLTAKSIRQKHYESLYDFDEHLENLDLDWLGNGEISALIKAY